jgi:hypothetical protein
MYGYLSNVGWAKATLRRAHHSIRMHGRMVGTPPDAFASGVSAHPTNSFHPYRRVANPWKFFRQSVATAASLAVTNPPRKGRLLPHEKNVPQFCLRFVSTKSHDVNVRRRSFLATRLKRLTQLRISHHTARHARRAASPHAAQVLHATMDFRACESVRRVMRDQALEAPRFFPVICTPGAANCLQSAATRLKFAARLVDSN